MLAPEQIQEENLALKEKVAHLEAQIEWLKKQLFGGGKSEKLDCAQLLLKLDELQQAVRDEEEKIEKVSYERRKPTHRELPAERFENLPVKETVEIEPEEVKADPELYERIGEEETFEVDIVPPKLFKRRIVYPKYRHRLNRSLPPVLAAAPKRAVEGGYASAGLLAWIMLSKFVDHLPLFRLEKMSARWGARLSRKTMVDWVQIVSDWLQPIYGLMREDLISGGYIQADETPVKFMDPDQKKGKTTKGYLWVISRPGGDVVFDWRLTRCHGEATSLLKGFKGVLQSDAYGAYKAFHDNNLSIVQAGCWAHARRKFFDSLSQSPREAELVMRLIARLYHLESLYRQERLDHAAREQRRKKDTPVLLERLHKVIRICHARARPTQKLGEACAYALSQWKTLISFVEHGEVEIDNNLVENAIRPSAVGKRNWLFVGSPEAGNRTAIIYSIVVSCQRHGVDPYDYLKDVLSRLPAMTNQDDLSVLLPKNWAAARATAQSTD